MYSCTCTHVQVYTGLKSADDISFTCLSQYHMLKIVFYGTLPKVVFPKNKIRQSFVLSVGRLGWKDGKNSGRYRLPLQQVLLEMQRVHSVIMCPGKELCFFFIRQFQAFMYMLGEILHPIVAPLCMKCLPLASLKPGHVSQALLGKIRTNKEDS